MNIYTKTGDKGTTSLINGTRVPKNHIRVEAYGTIDELNAQIALIEAMMKDKTAKKELLEIEKNLFIIQTHLAIDPEKECFFCLPDIQKINANDLEQHIDRMNKDLTPMKSFILLGGDVLVAQCHIARCICRRAERILITLLNESFVHSEILSYINRLSDYLFILARYVGKRLGVEEGMVGNC
jgi:cob(I)alamin adenosyltransferase